MQEKIVPGVEHLPVEWFQRELNADHYNIAERHGHAFEELLLFDRPAGWQKSVKK